MTITDFKDKYTGKRVFLIGNGPSLANTPLELLKDEYSFAMNRISLIYEKTSWRPSFFICTTTNIASSDWKKNIFESISLGIPCFVWDELQPHMDIIGNINYLKCTHGEKVTEEAPEEWWSFDIEKYVCKFGTSMLVALQVAVYMGFNPIYLLGCDLGFKEAKYLFRGHHKLMKILNLKPSVLKDPNHFDQSYGTPGFDALTLNKNMVAAHKLALKSSEKIGVKIYNATPGGNLNVYPRINLKDALKS